MASTIFYETVYIWYESYPLTLISNILILFWIEFVKTLEKINLLLILSVTGMILPSEMRNGLSG